MAEIRMRILVLLLGMTLAVPGGIQSAPCAVHSSVKVRPKCCANEECETACNHPQSPVDGSSVPDGSEFQDPLTQLGAVPHCTCDIEGKLAPQIDLNRVQSVCLACGFELPQLQAKRVPVPSLSLLGIESGANSRPNRLLI